MEAVAIVTVLALMQALWFGTQVAMARVRYGVDAPAITGNPEFERSFRVHQNTLEQLVLFVPALWIFAHFVNAPIAAGLGVVYVLGRFVYRRAYLADPRSRSAGFTIGAVATVTLMLGGLVGAILAIVRG